MYKDYAYLANKGRRHRVWLTVEEANIFLSMLFGGLLTLYLHQVLTNI